MDSIEWRDNSSSLLITSIDDNLMELQYIITGVTEHMQGQIFTCIVTVGDYSYTKRVTIDIEGILYQTIFVVV